MLPHYSPLKVAESFSLLSGLFPGRIDLGIGRASGTDPVTTHVLQRDRRQAPPDDFFDQLAELLAYLEDRFPDDHPLKRLTALPGPARGARAVAARLLAAERDLGRRPRHALRVRRLHQLRRRRRHRALYRERFADSERLPTPRAAVAVWAIAADTEEEAQRLAYSSRMAMAMLRRGRLIPVPPVEKAERFLKGEGLLDKPVGRRLVLGTPDRVRAELEQVAADYHAEEVIVVSITYDHDARRRSYELIAEAFGLGAAQPLAA